MSLGITSLNSFDIINGKMSVAVHMAMFWTDTQLQWKPAEYGGISEMSLEKEKVWRPFLNQYTQTGTTEIPNSASVWLFHTGVITWKIVGTLYTGCEINVIKYPFDKHQCEFLFYSERHQRKELLVNFHGKKVDLSDLLSNGEWEIGSNSCKNLEHSGDIAVSGFSCLLSIERRPAFVMLHEGLPLICLTALTLSVFWVPVDCGERISLSVTLFLAFSVMISSFTEYIPRNSIKVPLYSVLLIFLHSVSSTSVGLSIIVVRLSLKTNKTIPDWLTKLMSMFGQVCKKRKHSETKPSMISGEKHESTDVIPFDEEITKKFTWIEFAKFVDHIAFIVVAFAFVINSFVLIGLAFGSV